MPFTTASKKTSKHPGIKAIKICKKNFHTENHRVKLKLQKHQINGRIHHIYELLDSQLQRCHFSQN